MDGTAAGHDAAPAKTEEAAAPAEHDPAPTEDAAADALAEPPVADFGPEMLVARHDLLAVRHHLLGRQAGIDLQVAQRAVEAVDVLLQAERLAVKGARHVEGSVAVLPAAVAERDHDLVLGHELAIEPGDALIAELLGHGVSPDLNRCLEGSVWAEA